LHGNNLRNIETPILKTRNEQLSTAQNWPQLKVTLRQLFVCHLKSAYFLGFCGAIMFSLIIEPHNKNY
jgi:hypothetical protein